MPKYVIMIHGVNFWLREEREEKPKIMGFFVNLYVESPTPEEAETEALRLVRESSRLRETVENPPGNAPRMLVEEIGELDDWPEDSARPMSGFIFYDDTKEEWRDLIQSG